MLAMRIFAAMAVPASLAAAKHVLVFEMGHGSVLPIYLSTLLFVAAEVAYQHPKLLAWVLVRRGWVSAGIGAYTASIAGFILWENWPSRELLWSPASGDAVLVGLLAGTVIRTLFVAGLGRLLTGEPSHSVEFLRLGAVAIYLVLFPAGVTAVSYQLGLSLGVLAHLIVRWHEQARVQRSRDRGLLCQMLEVADSFQPDEKEALTLLLSGWWGRRRLHRRLERLGGNAHTGLVLVKALLEMAEGRFDNAARILESELNRPTFNRHLETILRLAHARCFYDAGATPDETLARVAKVIEAQPNCVHAIWFKATLMASGQSLAEGGQRNTETLKSATELLLSAALRLETSAPTEWGKFLGRVAPVRPTHMFDTLALIFLKTGQCRFAKGMLIECIRRDPRFAPSYLHLAAYYDRAYLLSAPTEKGRQAAWLTQFCLWACIYLQPFETAVRRRAHEMLGEIAKRHEGTAAVVPLRDREQDGSEPVFTEQAEHADRLRQ